MTASLSFPFYGETGAYDVRAVVHPAEPAVGVRHARVEVVEARANDGAVVDADALCAREADAVLEGFEVSAPERAAHRACVYDLLCRLAREHGAR